MFNNILKMIYNIFTKVEYCVVIVGLSISTLIVFINTISRYFFSYSFSWAEEMTIYIVIWVAFFGAAICVKRGAHVTINILLPLIKLPGLKRLLLSLISITSAAFMIFLFYSGFNLLIRVKETGQVSPSMKFFPMYLLYLCVPIAALLMFVEFMKIFYISLKEEKINQKEN